MNTIPKIPEQFQWEGSVDASAEMPEIFQTEKEAFWSWVELSHGKVINFDKNHPLILTEQTMKAMLNNAVSWYHISQQAS